MSSLVVVSPQASSGKTTVAAGLAQAAREAGMSFSLKRLGDDANAVADAGVFAAVRGAAAGGAQVALSEAPAGDPAAALSGDGDAQALVVATAEDDPAQVAGFCNAIVPRLAGLIVNRVPSRRLAALRAAYQATSVQPLGFLPEDRLLAAPLLGEVASALAAESTFLGANTDRPVDRPLIAPVSADPGQAYFDRYGATAVIVRSDKPDLQLAALNAGADCLIVTGGLPILSYVLDRAEEDEIPLLRTSLDTVKAVGSIEALFASMPFAGGERKLQRIRELLADAGLSSLLG